MAPISFRLLSVAAVAAAAAAGSALPPAAATISLFSSSSTSTTSSSSSTTTATPPLLPLLDLSPAGLEALLQSLSQALAVPLGPLAAGGAPPVVSGLLTLVTDLLRSVEGLLLPQQQQQEAGRLTEALRDVFLREALLQEKLIALQGMAAEGSVSMEELLSLRAIARRLWEQFQQLENLGLRIVNDLTNVLKTVFPDLPIPTAEQMEAKQREIQQLVRQPFEQLLNN